MPKIKEKTAKTRENTATKIRRVRILIGLINRETRPDCSSERTEKFINGIKIENKPKIFLSLQTR